MAPQADVPRPLRLDVEAQPVEHEGQPLLVLSDPEGLAPNPIGVSQGGLMVAGLFDGKRSASDIAALIKKEAGAVVPLEQILALAAQLESAGFLETAGLAAKRRALIDGFKDAPARPAVHAGGGYPSEPAALGKELDAYLSDAKGPGAPLAASPAGAAPALLVSPHIDFRRGGPSYAWAYQTLSRTPPPDVVVALGVAHASPPSPWVMTRKAYETPLGPMEVDEKLYDAIAKRLWYDPRADELVHRREHSLEFQAVWLRYLWKDAPFKWVPILCSSFERWAPDSPPSSVSTVEGALEAVGRVLREEAGRRRVLILAGVDLAHVGPHFGDELALGPELEAKVEREDRASLEKALACDADGFYLSTVAGGHWRKVCGLSALYTALRWTSAVAPGATGRLLSYGQAPDPRGGLVSFASAVFTKG